jgi:hypothetical protein
MHNFGQPPSMNVTPRMASTKSRRGRSPKNNSEADVVCKPAGVGTLTRRKSLLGAALRVWELKQRISH